MILKVVLLNPTVLPHFYNSNFEPHDSQSNDVEPYSFPALL